MSRNHFLDFKREFEAKDENIMFESQDPRQIEKALVSCVLRGKVPTAAGGIMMTKKKRRRRSRHQKKKVNLLLGYSIRIFVVVYIIIFLCDVVEEGLDSKKHIHNYTT